MRIAMQWDGDCFAYDRGAANGVWTTGAPCTAATSGDLPDMRVLGDGVAVGAFSGQVVSAWSGAMVRTIASPTGLDSRVVLRTPSPEVVVTMADPAFLTRFAHGATLYSDDSSDVLLERMVMTPSGPLVVRQLGLHRPNVKGFELASRAGGGFDVEVRLDARGGTFTRVNPDNPAQSESVTSDGNGEFD